MELEHFPKLTVIMRGYSYDEAMTVIKVLSNFKQKVGVEVTTNNPRYLDIIRDGNKQYGELVYIGVGTILTVKHAQEAIDAGAQFMLGPNKFSSEIFKIAKKHNVITVPSAMTPTEVSQLFAEGADIVKIFPAITVKPSFFNQIQGPFGKLMLMAVGGINDSNAAEFVESGASYLGIGSSMFNKEDIKNKNFENLANSVQTYLDIWQD